MTRVVRVVHIVEDLRTGGLEKVVRDIVGNLDRTRFDPEVWCLARGGEIAEEIAASGVTVHVSEMGQRPSTGFLLRLAGRLRWANARIVHCHGYTACTVGRAAAILARTPRVFAHIHTQGFWLRPRQRRIERVLSAFSTKVVCVSESVREFVVQDERIPRQKTEVIYNGVPDPPVLDRASACRRLGVPEGSRVLACVASLESHKGHAILIDAVRIARTTLEDLVLLVVGDGSLRSSLEGRARTAGVPAIFTGRMADVDWALAAEDAMALLSLEREGLSRAVIETMAASKPVISSHVGGMPELVRDGVNGLLCRPGDASGAADCIVKVLGNPPLARSMGEAGRRLYVEQYTVGKMLSKIERLYDS
jgi:glycosyltransferase involved in cell wall biosynthesis